MGIQVMRCGDQFIAHRGFFLSRHAFQQNILIDQAFFETAVHPPIHRHAIKIIGQIGAKTGFLLTKKRA